MKSYVKDKNAPLTEEVIRKLPKAELHLHLDGSVRVGTIIELAKEQGVSLPTFDYEELKNKVYVGEDCQSLVDYLRAFDITLSVLQKPYAITRVMYEVCEDAVSDGVRYLEVRFSPILHTKEGMSLSQVMEAICEGQLMAEHNLPIFCRVIVCGMRQLDPRDTENLAEIAWRYKDKGVAGFDLAGPEYGFRSKTHKLAFDIAKRNFINVTLHAGEAAGPESIQDSVRWCGAHRIGHGVTLRRNPNLMHYVIDRSIPIECCITSNIQTRAIKSLEDHPIRQYFDAGAIVVPCTDNKTMSNCTLTGEYLLYQKTHKFNVEEMLRLIDYGFSAAFMQATHKRRLRGEVLHSCLRILAEEGYDIDSIIGLSHYWHSIGVDLTQFTKSPNQRKKHSYWSERINPPVTLDLVRSLPKADLNCRIDGSASVLLLWQELQAAKIDLKQRFGIECGSAEELKQFITDPMHDEQGWLRVKRIFNSVLQYPDQIKRTTENIIRSAADENVRYIELVVRPQAHIHLGMKAEQVIESIKEAADATISTLSNPMQYGIVIYASLAKDDPIEFLQTAQLAVKLKSLGVCGFGVLGTRDLKASEYEFFRGTFDFLKRNNVNVNISAGRTDPSNVVKALHEGGACRVSGAYQIHRSPDLMNYCANHSIPIELGLSEIFFIANTRKISEVDLNDIMATQNPELTTFVGNPIRLFIDNLLPVAICSFKASISPSSWARSELLLGLVNECKLSIAELMKLLSYSFENNFQPYEVRQRMVACAWEEASSYLNSQGYSSLYKQHYFPSLGKGMDSFSN